MQYLFTRIFFLVSFWFFCSQKLEPFFVACGVLSIWFCLYFSARLKLNSEESLFARPVALCCYAAWLFKEMALSAWQVSRTLWQITPRITPRLFHVPSTLKKPVALALYGNSITLTPGTVCVDITPSALTVHALFKSGMQDLAEGKMEQKIHALMESRI